MKKTSPAPCRIGSFREFAEWTKHVIRNPAAANDAPKKWFDSEETAARAMAKTPGEDPAASPPRRDGERS